MKTPALLNATQRTLDALYRKAADSWWVLRHDLDPAGQALPFGRVVYYATSEQEARRWLSRRGAAAS